MLLGQPSRGTSDSAVWCGLWQRQKESLEPRAGREAQRAVAYPLWSQLCAHALSPLQRIASGLYSLIQPQCFLSAPARHSPPYQHRVLRYVCSSTRGSSTRWVRAWREPCGSLWSAAQQRCSCVDKVLYATQPAHVLHLQLIVHQLYQICAKVSINAALL